MKTVDMLPEYVEGAVSLEGGPGWVKPWRIVFELQELFYPEDGLQATAQKASGVRLRFETDAETVALQVEPAEEGRPFDLTRAADLLGTVLLPAGEDTVEFGELAGKPTVYELWLPQATPIRLKALRVPEGAAIRPAADPRPRWCAYGSSITQCGGAHSPARTWPALVARRLGLNLTCLGYGGNCDIDPIVATMIRDLPADVITIKVGINVQAHCSFTPRTFQPAVIGFVRTIRERHPLTPIGVITAIISPPREDQRNAVGLSLSNCRWHTAEAVRRLRACGDEHLHLFSGLDLLGQDDLAYLPDDVHPNADGYELIGRRAADQVLPKLLKDIA
jgi:lysophospholipase L1-like esterase